MGVGKSRPRQSKSLNISLNPIMGECEFDTLFTRNVPHVLEKIFFSLDYASFKNCLEVSKPWHDLLTSESFLRKGKSVFCEDIQGELRLGASSGNVDTIIRIFSSFKADVNLMTERNTNPLSKLSFCHGIRAVLWLPWVGGILLQYPVLLCWKDEIIPNSTLPRYSIQGKCHISKLLYSIIALEPLCAVRGKCHIQIAI